MKDLNNARSDLVCSLGVGFTSMSTEHSIQMPLLGWYAIYDSLVALLAFFLSCTPGSDKMFPDFKKHPVGLREPDTDDTCKTTPQLPMTTAREHRTIHVP